MGSECSFLHHTLENTERVLEIEIKMSLPRILSEAVSMQDVMIF